MNNEEIFQFLTRIEQRLINIERKQDMLDQQIQRLENNQKPGSDLDRMFTSDDDALDFILKNHEKKETVEDLASRI